MIIVGLTGGIGSGKTTVAQEFQELGVPVYIADDEAKKIMHESKIVKRELRALFGDKAYVSGVLNKAYIAQKVFNDKNYLSQINTIIHPKVASHFQKWLQKQDAPYIIKEVAILFENGGDKYCDFIITVTATMNARIKRLLKRDPTTKEKILAIMKNQWTDEQRLKKSNFIIHNETETSTRAQVLKIHKDLLKNNY